MRECVMPSDNFRQPVYAGHAHEHFSSTCFISSTGQRACHDAGAEGGQVEHAEHRVIELGDEHGRNAVKGRAPFLVDGGEYDQRIEFFDHDLCASMRQDVHGASTTPKQWNRGTQQHSLSSAVNFMCSPVNSPLLAML